MNQMLQKGHYSKSDTTERVLQQIRPYRKGHSRKGRYSESDTTVTRLAAAILRALVAVKRGLVVLHRKELHAGQSVWLCECDRSVGLKRTKLGRASRDVQKRKRYPTKRRCPRAGGGLSLYRQVPPAMSFHGRVFIPPQPGPPRRLPLALLLLLHHSVNRLCGRSSVKSPYVKSSTLSR